jgi:hypothetical protein
MPSLLPIALDLEFSSVRIFCACGDRVCAFGNFLNHCGDLIQHYDAVSDLLIDMVVRCDDTFPPSSWTRIS